MTIVLDTCALIWWSLDPDKLSQRAKEACQQMDQEKNGLVPSTAIWEIAIKVKNHKNVPVDLGSRSSLLARSPCPENLEALVDRLLQDLPSYANRIIARSSFSPNTNIPPGYLTRHIILAGRAEFEPLPLNPETAIPKNARQVFITTLERQYRGGQPVEIQQYHWLFLIQTEKGWELVKIVSRFSAATDVNPLLPAEDEKSAIAEAIRLWLRDCNAK